MVTVKKEVINGCSYEEEAELLISKLRSLLEIGIASEFESHSNLSWHNYLCVLEELAHQIEEKLS